MSGISVTRDVSPSWFVRREEGLLSSFAVDYRDNAPCIELLTCQVSEILQQGDHVQQGNHVVDHVTSFPWHVSLLLIDWVLVFLTTRFFFSASEYSLFLTRKVCSQGNYFLLCTCNQLGLSHIYMTDVTRDGCCNFNHSFFLNLHRICSSTEGHIKTFCRRSESSTRTANGSYAAFRTLRWFRTTQGVQAICHVQCLSWDEGEWEMAPSIRKGRRARFLLFSCWRDLIVKL